ncbi:DUF413 domain-containing protein [Vibrio parahaemolyticus]|uniref:DUF413 domain-containing protein n=1 Tax=Vibrio parahaemolyticus TaxID=670 RepID=UPI00046E85B4|nr:DUF413 domain-containing protein [Vibrio parahaemolyticus]
MPTDSKHQSFLRKSFKIVCSQKNFRSEEIALLEKYGSWLDALMRKKILPTTKEQEHFVEVSFGKRPPVTEFETIWCKYQLEIGFHNALQMEKCLIQALEATLTCVSVWRVLLVRTA